MVGLVYREIKRKAEASLEVPLQKTLPCKSHGPRSLNLFQAPCVSHGRDMLARGGQREAQATFAYPEIMHCMELRSRHVSVQDFVHPLDFILLFKPPFLRKLTGLKRKPWGGGDPSPEVLYGKGWGQPPKKNPVGKGENVSWWGQQLALHGSVKSKGVPNKTWTEVIALKCGGGEEEEDPAEDRHVTRLISSICNGIRSILQFTMVRGLLARCVQGIGHTSLPGDPSVPGQFAMDTFSGVFRGG